jgi:hypothetical protein
LNRSFRMRCFTVPKSVHSEAYEAGITSRTPEFILVVGPCCSLYYSSFLCCVLCFACHCPCLFYPNVASFLISPSVFSNVYIITHLMYAYLVPASYKTSAVIFIYSRRIGHHYTQTTTNKINKTWATLQTTGGKDEPNIALMLKS